MRFEVVDGRGLLPFRSTDRVFKRAVDFRRHLQKQLLPHLADLPAADPFVGGLPRPEPLADTVRTRWPSLPLDCDPTGLPVDVGAVEQVGGPAAARRRWRTFLDERLGSYADGRNHPDQSAGSGMSPYLHYGHIAVAQLFADLARTEGWGPDEVSATVRGQRAGWWGMSPAAEAFLDELITWRELGLNAAAHMPGIPELRLAARVGAAHPGGPRRRPAAPPLHRRSARGGRDP